MTTRHPAPRELPVGAPQTILPWASTARRRLAALGDVKGQLVPGSARRGWMSLESLVL